MALRKFRVSRERSRTILPTFTAGLLHDQLTHRSQVHTLPPHLPHRPQVAPVVPPGYARRHAGGGEAERVDLLAPRGPAGACPAHDASYHLDIFAYLPPVINDPAASERRRPAAVAVLGEDAVSDGPLLMVAEDMSEFLDRVPGCFFVLGAMPETPSPAEPHHSPRFDIDEQALPLGTAILAGVAGDFLRKQND